MRHGEVPVNLIMGYNGAMLNMRNSLRTLPEGSPLRANARVDAINRGISAALYPNPYLTKYGPDMALVNIIANNRSKTDMQRDVVVFYRRKLCTYAWLLSQNPLSVISLAQRILDNGYNNLIPRCNDILQRHRFVLHGRTVPQIPENYGVLRGFVLPPADEHPRVRLPGSARAGDPEDSPDEDDDDRASPVVRHRPGATELLHTGPRFMSPRTPVRLPLDSDGDMSGSGLSSRKSKSMSMLSHEPTGWPNSFIDSRAFNSGILSIKYLTTRHQVPLKKQMISPLLQSIISGIMDSQTIPSAAQLSKLSPNKRTVSP
jgi:hypothetical protein